MTIDLPTHIWDPIYTAILTDFGFDRQHDERARDTLNRLCADAVLTPSQLPDISGECVWIAGAADRLRSDIDRLDSSDTIFAASTATGTLNAAGLQVALHVTDLDKDEEVTVARSQQGKPIALHAHGDNRDQIEQYVPRMDTSSVLPTTQAAPLDRVRNPGGFTDGDRAAFLAHALGAEELRFVGWDVTDSTVSPQKKQKLQWAERLLYWLETRRGEQFKVLAGRRSGIDISQFPDPRV